MTGMAKSMYFEKLLRSGGIVSVTLDARRGGVILPSDLKTKGQVLVQYGYNLPVPIQDLEFDTYGITATLSFGRVPFRTVVPWDAVYAIKGEQDEMLQLWRDDVPADIVERGAATRPKLKLVS